MTHRLFRILTLLLVCTLMFASCVETDADLVPSYVRVDTSYLMTGNGNSGSASHRIVDSWVYVDNEQIGVFETPVDVPVLDEGAVTLRLKAGVMANGISDARRAYEFYEPYETDVTLVKDSIIVVNPVYEYKDDVTFSWIEDFEDLQVSMKKTDVSDTCMFITTEPEEVFEKNASGKIVLTQENSKDFFELISDTTYVLPQDGSTVVLEIDYKTETVITIGLFAFDPLAHQVSVLNLNPTDSWKKVYVYLTTAITSYINSDYYKVFIGGYLEEGEEESVVLIDNIKLLY